MVETDTVLGGKVKNIVVLASGNGSNFQAIIDAIDRGEINAMISALITNNPDAYALKRAHKHGIPSVLIKPSEFGSREEYDDALLDALMEMDPDLIVLAGYMLLLGKRIVTKFKGRIINIHPALLPSFKGTHGVRDAFEYGVKITGVTVHFVDEGIDTGKIIAQEAVAILDDDTLKALEERIHKVEHKLYPQTIAELLDGNLARKDK
ncbi:MAG: phosphoribosylglycinamide formyltransferase [Actinobacteria bacterium]|nr:phosphoribosylglycinamide formyltransferase [Actinomycetota bacterium]